MNYLSREEFSEWLSYDPIKGEFRWIKSNSDKVKVGMLAGSKKTIVDSRGNKCKKGATVRIDGKSYSMTVVAYVLMTGQPPEKDIVHVNYDKWDFCWDNLTLMCRGESSQRVKNISEEDYIVNLVGFNGDYGKRERFVNQEVLNHERLKELIDYNPETGIITSKYSTAKMDKGSEMGSFETYGKGKSHTEGTRHRIRIKVMGETHSAHRLVWFWMTGDWPKGVIDHIDGDPWNNKWDNLRDVTSSENSKNVGLSRKNKSGVLGVYRDKRSQKWFAQIGSDNKRIRLGYFYEFDQAVKVRKEAEKKYNFHPNHGKRFVT